MAQDNVEVVPLWGGGFLWSSKDEIGEGSFSLAIKDIVASDPSANIVVVCSGNDIYPHVTCDKVSSLPIHGQTNSCPWITCSFQASKGEGTQSPNGEAT